MRKGATSFTHRAEQHAAHAPPQDCKHACPTGGKPMCPTHSVHNNNMARSWLGGQLDLQPGEKSIRETP